MYKKFQKLQMQPFFHINTVYFNVKNVYSVRRESLLFQAFVKSTDEQIHGGK